MGQEKDTNQGLALDRIVGLQSLYVRFYVCHTQSLIWRKERLRLSIRNSHFLHISSANLK